MFFQQADCLVLADRMIASLHVVIQERDREVNRVINYQTSRSPAKQAFARAVPKAYHLQLQEANMALCTGGDHVFRGPDHTFED